MDVVDDLMAMMIDDNDDGVDIVLMMLWQNCTTPPDHWDVGI